MAPGMGKGGYSDPPGASVNATSLAACPPWMRQQILGDRLHALISQQQPWYAIQITRLILESMDHTEILALVDDEERLKSKVGECLAALSGAEHDLQQEQ